MMHPDHLCRFHAIYSREDAPVVHPLLELIRRRPVVTFPRKFGILPWPSKWRLDYDSLERCDVVLLFWSDRAAQDEEVCSQVNRAMGAGKRFTMVNLDDSPAPGLPPGTPEHSAKIRFLAGHQWYAWVKQFSREVARAIAASHLRNGNARQDTVTSELLPSSHTRH